MEEILETNTEVKKLIDKRLDNQLDPVNEEDDGKGNINCACIKEKLVNCITKNRKGNRCCICVE